MRSAASFAVSVGAVLALFWALIACGVSDEPPGPTWPTVEIHRGTVTEITLHDGTRCALLWQGTHGGISCDWDAR